MAIEYRSLSIVDNGPDLVEVVEDSVRSWLSGKALALPATPSNARLFGDKTVACTRVEAPGWRGYRWSLIEPWAPPAGAKAIEGSRGDTSISLIIADEESWILVESDAPSFIRILQDGREERVSQRPGPPRIIETLATRLALRNGPLDVLADPQVIASPAQSDEVISHLQDDVRTASIIVTSPPTGVDFDAWSNFIRPITSQVKGLAVTYLIDPRALVFLNHRLGNKLKVLPGGMRTFAPGLLLGDDTDSLRHRALLPHRLRDSNPATLGRVFRDALMERLRLTALPDRVRIARRALLEEQRSPNRASASFVVTTSNADKSSPGARPGPKSDAPQASGPTLEFREQPPVVPVKPEVTETHLNEKNVRTEVFDAEFVHQLMADWERLDSERRTAERLRLDAEELQAVLELEKSELEDRIDDLENSLSDAATKVVALQQRLIRAHAVGEAYEDLRADEQVDYPGSFEALVTRLDQAELAYLKFFGKKKPAVLLDAQPKVASAVRKAWDSLLTLNDYARVKSEGVFGGGLAEYLDSSSHGGRTLLRDLKLAESESVRNNPKLLAQRTVKVPADFSPSQEIVTVMHCGLLTGSANSPRMYFYDNSSRNGFIVIGYIGAHLENTLTN